MKIPATTSPSWTTGATSGKAPHQLCPAWKRGKVTTIANAAGLNTFPARVRTTYLVTTANADVSTTTYHGVWTLSTMDTIRAVRTAPLGNSQRVWRVRRMTTSSVAA